MKIKLHTSENRILNDEPRYMSQQDNIFSSSPNTSNMETSSEHDIKCFMLVTREGFFPVPSFSSCLTSVFNF